VRFAFNDIVLTSKLIVARSRTQRVIPTGNDKTLEVDRREFRHH
jgi:DNA polymerase III sliding clamp (beta) subunit (PCNA family)